MLDHLEWSWRLAVLADFQQTSFLNLRGDSIYEMNPMFRGRSELANGLVFALTSEGVLLVARSLPKPLRKPFVGGALIHRLCFVVQNARLGVKSPFYVPLVSFKFRS